TLFPYTTLFRSMGKTLYAWDTKGSQFHSSYDVLHRPTSRELIAQGGARFVVERLMYGVDKTVNQNGRLIAQHDSSGLVTRTRYDFKGNVEEATRTFTA